MTQGVKNVKVSKDQAAHRQITRQLNEGIQNGKWAAGTQLPTISELSELWGVSVFTIHTALNPLVEAGLLIRRRGHGTFVAEQQRKLTCAAIYYGRDFWSGAAMTFYRHLHQWLCREFAKQKVDTRVFISSAAHSGHPESHALLREAFEKNEVQCLIAPDLDNGDFAVLRKLRIPSAFSVNYKGGTNKVGFDFRQFMELSIGALERQGCRSVGIISSYTSEDEEARHDAFFRHLVELATVKGIEIRKE
jgi:hypothetical protein